MADLKLAYRASSNLTVTNLHSIATSATWVAGWESGVVDNTTNKDLDILVSGKIALGNSATVGQIRVYIVAPIDDAPTWPDVMDGTESVETWTTTTIRDGAAKLGAAIETRADPGTDDVYWIAPFSVAALFGGVLPPKFLIFVTHSTGVNLKASDNQITVQGVYETVA
jgi:hypothetical protein